MLKDKKNYQLITNAFISRIILPCFGTLIPNSQRATVVVVVISFSANSFWVRSLSSLYLLTALANLCLSIVVISLFPQIDCIIPYVITLVKYYFYPDLETHLLPFS